MSNIIQIKKQYSADDILESMKGKLENVLVIGWGNDGFLEMTTTPTTASEINLLIDRAKQVVLDGDLVDEE